MVKHLTYLSQWIWLQFKIRYWEGHYPVLQTISIASHYFVLKILFFICNRFKSVTYNFQSVGYPFEHWLVIIYNKNVLVVPVNMTLNSFGWHNIKASLSLLVFEVIKLCNKENPYLTHPITQKELSLPERLFWQIYVVKKAKCYVK